jgi:drug/metabolite transporter (DMT)-like permease
VDGGAYSARKIFASRKSDLMLTPDQLEYDEREQAAPATLHSSRAIFQALLLLIPAILSSTTGQLFLKMGMNQVRSLAFTPDGILAALPSIVLNPFIWIGFLGWIGGTVFWLGVISRAPLSLAYPILATSYFVVVMESWLFLGEQVTPQKIIGVAVIVGGVILVGMSEPRT